MSPLHSKQVTSDTIEAFIDLARETYQQLCTENENRSSHAGKCLKAFRQAVLDLSAVPGTEHILEDTRIESIRRPLLRKLAKIEYEVESESASRFADNVHITMEDLNYYWGRQYHRKLVAREVSAMRKHGILPGKSGVIGFVGSGPVPLTAIDLHQETGCDIICIDYCEEAIIQSREVIRKLGMDDKITFHQSDGAAFDYKNCDMVMMASMVLEKDNVAAQVRKTAPHAGVGMRTVEGLRALLYEAVDIEAISNLDLLFLGSSQKDPDTVNTAHFFKPRSAVSNDIIMAPESAVNRIKQTAAL